MVVSVSCRSQLSVETTCQSLWHWPLSAGGELQSARAGVADVVVC